MAKSIATRLLNAGASKSGISKVWIRLLLSSFPLSFFILLSFFLSLFLSFFLSFSLSFFLFSFLSFFLSSFFSIFSLLYSTLILFSFSSFLIDYCPFLFLSQPSLTQTENDSDINNLHDLLGVDQKEDGSPVKDYVSF